MRWTVVALLGLGVQAQAAEPGLAAPRSSWTGGLGGPLLPVPEVAYERYLGERGSVLVEVGLLPLLALNVGHVGVGGRRYLTGGAQAGCTSGSRRRRRAGRGCWAGSRRSGRTRRSAASGSAWAASRSTCAAARGCTRRCARPTSSWSRCRWCR
ncbi:MAG: hypothetical protein R3F59_21165 [Myxococcota bacterium]